MKNILVISESDAITSALKEFLEDNMQVWCMEQLNDAQVHLDLILIAAHEDFSVFLQNKELISTQYPKTPAFFIWIEEEYYRVLTFGELRGVDGRIIPRCKESLLACIRASIEAASGEALSDNDQCLAEIQSQLHKNNHMDCSNGALQVAYDNFASIYQFVEKLSERSGQSVQALLLTLVPRYAAKPDADDLEYAMSMLSEAIQMTLRKNDVLTGCSHSQMLVLLMDADDDGGHLATNRILNTFLGLYDADAYDLHYDIRPVGAKV